MKYEKEIKMALKLIKKMLKFTLKKEMYFKTILGNFWFWNKMM